MKLTDSYSISMASKMIIEEIWNVNDLLKALEAAGTLTDNGKQKLDNYKSFLLRLQTAIKEERVDV